MNRKIFKLIKDRGVWKAVTVASVDELDGCFGVIDNYELAYPGMSDNWFKHEYEIIPQNGNGKDLDFNGWIFDRIISVVVNDFKGEIRSCSVMAQNNKGEETECTFYHFIQKMSLLETIFNSIYLVAVCNSYSDAEAIIENVLTYLSLWNKNKANEYLQKLHDLKPLIGQLNSGEPFDANFSSYLSRMSELRQNEIINYLKSY